MSEYLQKIVYLTDSQYTTLSGGGTVGSLTGINDSYLYVTNGTIKLADIDSNLILPVSNGGTGASSWASGQVLVGNGGSTFTTISKTTAATGNTLVQRDSSGGFSAGTITATLSGNATTATRANITATQYGIAYYSATNGTFASTGAGTAGYLLQSNATSAPGWIQATDANTANTIVKRDASKNFSAGTITATFSGNLTGNVTGNADSSTVSSYLELTRVTETVNHLPSKNRFLVREYSSSSANLPSAHFYHVFEGKGDDGAYGTQLALGMTNTALYYRRYASSSWESWQQIVTNSGTWAISISGTATTATSLSPSGEAGFTTDASGNFKHKRSTNTDYWHLDNSAGTAKFSVYWETGVLQTSRGIFTSTTDALPGSVAGVALITGDSSGTHMEFDNNEIIAKSNASTKSTLYLNESCQVTSEGKVTNAVWNDYAEYRQSETIEPGYCVSTQEDGIMRITTKRMHKNAHIISDTYGNAIGISDIAKTPIAVAGRVLAYPYQNRNNYHIGDCVCATYDGKIDIMTREEIKEYPDRIIGIVDEIPNYEIWEQSYTFFKTGQTTKSKIKVNGRIWIYVR